MPEWRSELRVKSRKWLILLALRDGLLGAARLAPSGPPFGRSTWPGRQVVEPGLFYVGGSNCGRKTGLAKNRFLGRKPMAPRDGFEPPTNGLTVRRSTTELPGNTEEARIVGKRHGEVKVSGVPDDGVGHVGFLQSRDFVRFEFEG